MKSFLNRHKWRIIFWAIFLTIVFYLAPVQSDYYLEADIHYFKSHFLMEILVWAGALISILLLFILFVRTKSIKRSTIAFFYAVAILACVLFVLQDLFLAASLFINRKFKRDSVQKTYLVSYMVGTDQTRENFDLYDISTGHITLDNKLKNKLYHSGLKQNDTLSLNLDKGLFGIAFQEKPFKK